MQREIKFRGKRVDDGRWVYGYYIYMGVTRRYADMEFAHMILDSSSKDAEGLIQNEVIPETVGQFTGLKDKNGKEIYGGDIVRQYADCDEYGCSLYYRFLIEFDKSHVGFCANEITSKGLSNDKYYGEDMDYYEVIGNIYDNPELLQEVSE